MLLVSQIQNIVFSFPLVCTKLSIMHKHRGQDFQTKLIILGIYKETLYKFLILSKVKLYKAG